MSIRYEFTRSDIDGAAYQSWLRRHIAVLEGLQETRVQMVAERKKQLDATVERAAREIVNLKAQQTIGVAQ